MRWNKAFTLIELMISITILVILTIWTYVPYNYYENKAKLKVSARNISQLLYETKNMAENWIVSSDSNVSVWVFFDTNILNNNKIKVFSYPYDIENNKISYIEWWSIKLIKTLQLKKWMQIDDLEWKNNLLVVFDSITWKINYYNWEWGVRKKIEDDILSINISYKGSSSDNLKKTINYFTKTNITDY